MSVSVQGRLPARRHGGMRCSRSLSVLAREMPPRLTRPARRNCSVRFDQLEVAEAARSTRHYPRAQALVDNRPGGGDSFATPVALVHVALDRHPGFPFRGFFTETARSLCMPGTRTGPAVKPDSRFHRELSIRRRAVRRLGRGRHRFPSVSAAIERGSRHPPDVTRRPS
jgi:hypothetical protein